MALPQQSATTSFLSENRPHLDLHASATDVLAADTRNGDPEFLADVLRGLASDPKRLSSKYFYDQRGSLWFDRICTLPEYYPTRTELGILQSNIDEICDRIGSNVHLIEWGSGSSLKTRLLLKHLSQIQAYYPVDVSGAYLNLVADELTGEFADLNICPIVGDFTNDLDAPWELKDRSNEGDRCIFFPGSTIGNFSKTQAAELLELARDAVGERGRMLIGFDLQKDRNELINAYDDAQGVTAEFNRNLLVRINRELGADFDLDAFEHQVLYDEHNHRIEMHLKSLRRQFVSIDDATFEFKEDETICTEHSHKYTVIGFAKMAHDAGWHLSECWTDNEARFAVALLETDF
ncbi:MAG: L-histidine N(alpha)-methyltransferase [Planctomycetota bacterium]